MKSTDSTLDSRLSVEIGSPSSTQPTCTFRPLPTLVAPADFSNQSLVAMMIPLFTIVLALVPAQARRAQESNYSQPAYFKFYQDNLGAEYLKRCFKRQVPPNDGDSCRRNAKACLSGQQTCPKETPGGDIQSSSR